MNHSKSIVYSIGLFISGVAVGVLLTLSLAPRRHFDPKDSQKMAQHMKERLTSRLSLRPDQVTQIEPILKSQAESLVRIHSATKQQIRDVFDGSDQQIMQVLDAKQLEQFQEYRNKRSSRHSERPPSP